MKTVITRYTGFVYACLEIGLIKKGEFEVLSHATPKMITGKTVITSELPLHLAALCKEVITIPLNLPPELRGIKLTSEQVLDHMEEPQSYIVAKKEEFYWLSEGNYSTLAINRGEGRVPEGLPCF